MNETNNTYVPNAIDPAILSVLDVELDGKIVTAETWKSLWNLVITHVNSIDAYLVTIEQFRIEWEQGLELLNTIIEEFRVKYEALASSFIHYGVDKPTNEHIQLWCKPVSEVQDYGFIMAASVNYRGYFPLGEIVLNDTLRTGLYSIAKGSTFVFKQDTTELLESAYTASSHGLLIVSENENSTHTKKIIQFTFYGTLAEEVTADEIINGVYSAYIKKTLSDGVWSSAASDFHNISEDISVKQDKADNSLETSDKTIVGAINELQSGKGTYSKPGSGIPKSDLSSNVQTSLDKADTALQQHQDISGKADKTYVDTELAKKQDKTDNSLNTNAKTVVGAVNELNTGKADKVNVTSADAGKFMRVSPQGEWGAEEVPNANGVNF